jgi:DNA polymerase-1
MHRRGVLELFDIECRLIPLLVAMRIKGAPVDLERTQHIYDDLSNDLVIMEKQLLDIAGQPVNPNARDSMTSAFNKLGIPIPTKIDTKTKERKVSFDAPRLEAIDHPLAAAVLEHKRTTKVRDVFVKSYIMDKNINGRVHCSFHPLKNDGGGARSGRFSSSDPNLQNIPVRSEIGKKVRTCFKGGGVWRKADYSQIEYRMLAHHAVGEGADELRLEYNQRPDTDFHVRTTDLVARLTGMKMERRPIKNINFGLIYGMSELKLIGDLGLSKAGGKELFANYHTAAPYIKETMDAAVQEVHRMGYVETILGRKSDFTSWGKKGYDKERRSLSYEAAIDKWGTYGIERANTHKALNRKLQGGAADVMKKAMVEAYEAGLFSEDACGIPLLTVHDELDFDDVNDPNGPWWAEFKRVMENAVPQIKVPVMIDISAGPSWGEAD